MTTKHRQTVQQALTWNWYTQGFTAMPLFLNHAAWSGIPMKEELGYGYTGFLFHYKKGYGEMSYLNDDFDRVWHTVAEKLVADPEYLHTVKQRYEEIFEVAEALFKKIDDLDLRTVSDDALLRLLEECARAQVSAVGLGHILDSISVGAEKEFKKQLAVAVKDQVEFNRAYVVLTTPSKLSFVTQEERDLWEISRKPAKQQAKLLERHRRHYHWVHNSYAGPREMTVEHLRERLAELTAVDTSSSDQSKEKLISTLQLSPEIHQLLTVIDYAIVWQDERKAKVLKTVSYLGQVVAEISQRVNIPVVTLYYLGVHDIEQLTSLSELAKMQNILLERTNGCYFFMNHEGEVVVSGEDYQALRQAIEAINPKEHDQQIHGSIANPGTAIGKVAVCTTLSSLHKVNKGDVLVASMTRPEYMTALKKAVAIVTDEGGITSHAAIVARELKIPAIIGTKVATKVLHDGMTVEVRANHGFVRVINT